jgi:hypothetical protein
MEIGDNEREHLTKPQTSSDQDQFSRSFIYGWRGGYYIQVLVQLFAGNRVHLNDIHFLKVITLDSVTR